VIVSRYDAVIGWHMNPASCGVAKFNTQLAAHLGVPFRPLRRAYRYGHPLVSIKASELGHRWLSLLPKHGDLLLHDRPSHVPIRRIFYADELGCPSTIVGNPTRGRYRVLTFGMAHKRILHHYEALKARLDVEHPDYTLEMSTAIHEGTPWEEGLQQSVREMSAIFGDRLRVLGFPADDAIAKELEDCDAVALYFDPAFRANNTTAWAAIKAGKTLYTNLDAQSPTEMPTWDGLINVLTGAEAIASTTLAPYPDRRSESLDDHTVPPAA